MNQITARDLKRRLDAGEKITLINALEPQKFAAMHIPHSLNIVLREDIERQLDKNDVIVVYCTDFSCNKSVILYQLLEVLGYSKVCRFAGGIREWDSEGFPLAGNAVK
jgi:adenylyltransferase/sulfurtransferase